MKFHSPKEVLDTAKSSDTSPEDLDELLGYNYTFVNDAVAGNRNTSISTLNKLAQLASIKVLAENPNSDVGILLGLTRRLPAMIDCGRENHTHFGDWLSLCLNEKMPIDIVRNIMTSLETCTKFREVLARRTSRTDVLQILSADRSEKVRVKAISRINLIQSQQTEAKKD